MYLASCIMHLIYRLIIVQVQLLDWSCPPEWQVVVGKHLPPALAKRSNGGHAGHDVQPLREIQG